MIVVLLTCEGDRTCIFSDCGADSMSLIGGIAWLRLVGGVMSVEKQTIFDSYD